MCCCAGVLWSREHDEDAGREHPLPFRMIRFRLLIFMAMHFFRRHILNVSSGGMELMMQKGKTPFEPDEFFLSVLHRH